MRPNIRPARTLVATPSVFPATLAGLTSTVPGELALIVGASLLVAVAAHISVPLPFTPVPLTMGNLAVVLVGLALRPRAAFAALTLYLAEGAAGLPVFSSWGVPGIAHLIGPTGGYLLAYPFAAALVGLITGAYKRRTHAFLIGALAATAATALILGLGTLWLGVLAHVSAQAALMMGVVPFLPGEAVKIVCAAGIFATLRSRQA